MKKVCSLVIAIILIFSQSAFAGEYTDEMSEKLKRGLTNIVTSIAEVGKTMQEEMENDPDFLPFDTVAGFINGSILAINRAVRGVYDVAVAAIPNAKTFPPDPEYLFSSDTQSAQ